MKQHLVTVNRNDVELIAKIESMGTWEAERWLYDAHNSFDVWSFNGNYYKIYKDSDRDE